jgi:hypothetical protein
MSSSMIGTSSIYRPPGEYRNDVVLSPLQQQQQYQQQQHQQQHHQVVIPVPDTNIIRDKSLACHFYLEELRCELPSISPADGCPYCRVPICIHTRNPNPQQLPNITRNVPTTTNGFNFTNSIGGGVGVSDTSVFKTPRGVLRIIQFIFSIVALACTAGVSGFGSTSWFAMMVGSGCLTMIYSCAIIILYFAMKTNNGHFYNLPLEMSGDIISALLSGTAGVGNVIYGLTSTVPGYGLNYNNGSTYPSSYYYSTKIFDFASTDPVKASCAFAFALFFAFCSSVYLTFSYSKLRNAQLVHSMHLQNQAPQQFNPQPY